MFKNGFGRRRGVRGRAPRHQNWARSVHPGRARPSTDDMALHSETATDMHMPFSALDWMVNPRPNTKIKSETRHDSHGIHDDNKLQYLGLPILYCSTAPSCIYIYRVPRYPMTSVDSNLNVQLRKHSLTSLPVPFSSVNKATRSNQNPDTPALNSSQSLVVPFRPSHIVASSR